MPDDSRTFTVFGRTIRPGNFLSPNDTPTIGPVTFLSSVPEKHAAGVGFVVALGILLPLVLGVDPVAFVTALFGGTAAATRSFRKFKRTSHVRDAVNEIAYVALGAVGAVVVVVAAAVVAVALDRDLLSVGQQFIDWLRFAFQTA